jgi:hypothetical protein
VIKTARLDKGEIDMDNSKARNDASSDTPHAKRSTSEDGVPDQLDKIDQNDSRQEALVDEGLEETFPASDPVSAKRIT